MDHLARARSGLPPVCGGAGVGQRGPGPGRPAQLPSRSTAGGRPGPSAARLRRGQAGQPRARALMPLLNPAGRAASESWSRRPTRIRNSSNPGREWGATQVNCRRTHTQVNCKHCVRLQGRPYRFGGWGRIQVSGRSGASPAPAAAPGSGSGPGLPARAFLVPRARLSAIDHGGFAGVGQGVRPI